MGKKVKKFIDKSQSLTFQVVHRSQRDPAMADNDSSKLVLKPVAPSYNLLKKGKVLDMPEVDYDYEEMSDEDDEDDDEFDLEDDLDDSEYDEEVDFGREREEKEAHDHEAALQALKLAPELGQGPDSVKQAAAAVEKSSGPVDAKKDVSVFGIFFKDQKEYDYAQHLKIMGEDPNAIYIDSKKVLEQKKAEAKGKAGIKFL
ncbi:hypothetical protein HDU80_003698, partial [Chytriomyces hyalinus]